MVINDHILGQRVAKGTYTLQNQVAGIVESELYFEYSVGLGYDDELDEIYTVVFIAKLIGFAQFNDGKMVACVEGLNIDYFRVSGIDYDAFEKAIISRANDQINEHKN